MRWMTPIESVLQHFFPHSSVKTAEPTSGGLINQTFRVELEDGQVLIVQKINTKVFKNPEEIHRNIDIVGKHLLDTPYPYAFPIPIKTENNSSFIEFENEVWRVMPLVVDSYSVQKPTSLKMAKNAGKCLGQFHVSTRDLDPSKLSVTIPDFHSGVLRIDQFEHAVRESDQTGLKLVGEIYKHLHTLQGWDDICSEAPTRIVHFDTKIENFLFNNGTEEVAALIDLDTIMPGSILSDIGDMIRSFCDEDLKYRKALLEGYLSEMKHHLSEHENSFLKFAGCAITLMQAVRFLTDHLNGDVYYQIQYEGQNLDRAEQQFALYLQLHS